MANEVILDPKTKAEIDAMTYEQLLERWRNDPSGSALFQGASGLYCQQRMAELRQSTPHAQQVAASKRIGWEGR